MPFRQITTALILFGAIMGCYGDTIIIGLGPPPPPPPPPPKVYPVTVPGPFTIDECASVDIQLDPTNSFGDPVTYSATASNGTVTIDGTSMTYTPKTNSFLYSDQINFSANDPWVGSSFTGTISITFTPVPGPPVVSFTVSPLISFLGATNPVILCASNSQLVAINVDGSGTFDLDLLPAYLSWYDGTNCILTNATSGTAWLAPGHHTLSVVATDNTFTNSANTTFDVLTPGAAANDVETFVGQLPWGRKYILKLQRPLFKAAAWYDAGKPHKAYIEVYDLSRFIQQHQSWDPFVMTEMQNAVGDILVQLPAKN